MTHITIEREKLERVLEALEVLSMKHYELTSEVLHKETYAVLEEALAQPAEQKPVAWCVVGDGKFGEYKMGQTFVDYEEITYWENRGYDLVPVYTNIAKEKP